jgi:uncharacterized membrane protein YdjX (TVP38/TMEM64 family)
MKKIPFSMHEIIGAFVVALLFIVSAYLSGMYSDEINELIGSHKVWGIFLYIGSAVFATVLAPVSATPLIPVASSLWGPFWAGVYSIVGWAVGAVIAFWIARRFGYKVVGKFVKIKQIQEQATHIPKKNLFWSVVLMRMLVPVDVLSYVLGLFSDMKVSRYTLATVLGITPFAFVFSYAVHLPPYVQVFILLLVGVFVIIGYKQIKKNLTK